MDFFLLRCIAHVISPRAAFHLLQCYGCSASLLFLLLKRLLSQQMSLLYGEAGRESTCLQPHVTTSCVSQSLPVTPHCLPLPILQQYPPPTPPPTRGSIFVSISCWITEAMQKTIWHDVVLKRASLRDAVLPCLL